MMFDAAKNFLRVTVPFLFREENLLQTTSSVLITAATTVTNTIGPLVFVKAFDDLSSKNDDSEASNNNVIMDPVMLVLLFGFAFSLARTFVITHRLNTIINADNIIFIEGGSVIEEGSYTHLMQIEGGKFRKLMELYVRETQAKNELSDSVPSSSSSISTLIISDPFASTDDSDDSDDEDDVNIAVRDTNPFVSPLLPKKKRVNSTTVN